MKLAARRPGLLKAIVTVELTATPELAADEENALAQVPQLILWGDNWRGSAFWRKTHDKVEQFANRLGARGAHVQLLDLPVHGITGNTHQMMMDHNNDVILNIVSAWLTVNVGAPARQ